MILVYHSFHISFHLPIWTKYRETMCHCVFCWAVCSCASCTVTAPRCTEPFVNWQVAGLLRPVIDCSVSHSIQHQADFKLTKVRLYLVFFMSSSAAACPKSILEKAACRTDMPFKVTAFLKCVIWPPSTPPAVRSLYVKLKLLEFY